MLDNFKQNFIRTFGVFNKKPIIAELIGNGKFVSAKLEVEPHSDYAVRDKFGYSGAVEFLRVIVEFVKEYDFRHINEMP